jgi:hypothetical protein
MIMNRKSPKEAFFSRNSGKFTRGDKGYIDIVIRIPSYRTCLSVHDAERISKAICSSCINAARMASISWGISSNIKGVPIQVRNLILNTYYASLDLVERRRIRNSNHLSAVEKIRVLRKWFERSKYTFDSYGDMIRRFSIACVDINIGIYDIIHECKTMDESYASIEALAQDAYYELQGLIADYISPVDVILVCVDKKGVVI